MTPDQDPKISRWTATFVDRAWERAFRVETFAAARRYNRTIAVIISLLVIGHAWSDWTATGGGPLFWAFLSVRLATAAMILMVFPTSATPRRYALSDWGVFMAQMALVASFVYISASQVPAVMQERMSVISMTAMVILIGLYLFVRTRPMFHLAAGVSLSAGYIGAGIAVGRLAPEPAVMEATVHLVVNVLAFFSVLRVQSMQRRRFASVRALEDANQRLAAQSRAVERAARALREARDDAVYANRAKSEFLAHMSHELRSPMNAIIGFSEVMKEQVFGPISPPRYREYAEDIHSSGTHLLSVINDILDLSKAEAGKIEMQDDLVDLREMLQSVGRLVSERARRAELKLETEIAADLPDLRGDRRLIKQMVLNLLTNAIKFTPAQGQVVTSAWRERDGGVRIAVRDTGVGIEESDIPHILEPYGQVAAADQSGQDAGTGLGLPLVKNMIEVHEGRLEIHSTPGEGSRFTLVFPARRSIVRHDGAEQEHAPGAAPPHGPSPRRAAAE